MENQTDTQSVDKIDNPEVLALTLQTPVNRKYDGPNAIIPMFFRESVFGSFYCQEFSTFYAFG